MFLYSIFIKSLHSSEISNLVKVPPFVFFANVYFKTESIYIAKTTDSILVLDVFIVLYCGLLKDMFAIVYFFIPNIIAFSISKANDSNNSSGNVFNPDSNGFVKKVVAFIPLL